MPLLKKFLRSLNKLFKSNFSFKSPQKKKKKRKKSSAKKFKPSRRKKSPLKKIKPEKKDKKIVGKPLPQLPKHPIGEITHYFSRIQVVVVKLTKGELHVGDEIQVQGRTTNFSQKIQSMQIESVDVKSAKRGQLIGLKVKKEARVRDRVYKLK